MDLTARLRDGTVHHGAAVIDIVVLVDDVEFKLVRVPYDLRRFRPMLVTTEAIRRGTPLSEGQPRAPPHRGVVRHVAVSHRLRERAGQGRRS